jgi:hypothetical protein
MTYIHHLVPCFITFLVSEINVCFIAIQMMSDELLDTSHQLSESEKLNRAITSNYVKTAMFAIRIPDSSFEEPQKIFANSQAFKITGTTAFEELLQVVRAKGILELIDTQL